MACLMNFTVLSNVLSLLLLLLRVSGLFSALGHFIAKRSSRLPLPPLKALEYRQYNLSSGPVTSGPPHIQTLYLSEIMYEIIFQKGENTGRLKLELYLRFSSIVRMSGWYEKS